MPNYGFARAAIWFFEVLGGIATGGAVIGALLIGVFRPELADPVLLVIWGLAGVLAGLAAVALAQIVRAMVDTAEHTAELVRLFKRQAAPAAGTGLVAERPAAEPAVALRGPARAPGRSEPPLTRPQAVG